MTRATRSTPPPQSARPGRGRTLVAVASSLVALIGAALADADPPCSRPAALNLSDYVVSPLMRAPQAAPLRIVSAAPNITELCCALGLRDALVGRTRYCEHPPGITDVRSIGALLDMNNEALLELRAELILVAGASVAQSDKLRGLGLRYESLPDRRLEDLFTTIARIGELAGAVPAAERLAGALRSDLHRVQARHAGDVPKKVLLVIGPLADPPTPPHVAGPQSFYDDLLRLGGHQNAAPEASAFGQLSLEFIVRSDPEVIIEIVAAGADRPAGDIDALQAWSKLGPLRAVRDQRVHALVGHRHYVLGPRLALTADELLSLIAATP